MASSAFTWSRVHVLAAMFLGTAGGLGLGACFNPPAAAVMFACDAADDDAVCPDGYACEADGCCHRNGSDVEAELGACRIGGPGSASAASTGASEPTTTDATTTNATTADATTTDATTTDATSTDATTTDATTDTSTSTGATDTSTGTGDTSGSSSASSTG